MTDKTETFLRVLVQKDMVESIFKSWAWVLATAAIIKVSVSALTSHHILFGIITFVAFIALSVLVIIYAVLYVALPLNKIIENPNALTELKLHDYLCHPISSFLSLPFVFYLVATVGFFLFSIQLVEYLARASLVHG